SSIAVLLLAGVAAAQDSSSYEGLVKKHARERATVARVKSRTVAVAQLRDLLDRQDREMSGYAETASEASRALALSSVTDYRVEKALLDLAPDHVPANVESDRLFAVAVEQACSESQEKLVQVLDARAKAKKIRLEGPGALLVDGEKARALGVRWGKVELLVDRQGTIRGVDLVGDERQNLLEALRKEVPR
ncbi:MAG: hypothetical protein ACAI25_16270, partial [Planctomycetota bacterium]